MSKKHILIPLDGSDLSKQILPVIHRHFNPDESDLILLQVTQSGLDPDLERYEKANEETRNAPVAERWEGQIAVRAWREREKAIRSELKENALPLHNAGFSSKIEIRSGKPAKVILDYINEGQINMVAMATHGRTGFNRLLMGSVAEEVLHNSSVPVLLIRPTGLAESVS